MLGAAAASARRPRGVTPSQAVRSAATIRWRAPRDARDSMPASVTAAPQDTSRIVAPSSIRAASAASSGHPRRRAAARSAARTSGGRCRRAGTAHRHQLVDVTRQEVRHQPLERLDLARHRAPRDVRHAGGPSALHAPPPARPRPTDARRRGPRGRSEDFDVVARNSSRRRLMSQGARSRSSRATPRYTPSRARLVGSHLAPHRVRGVSIPPLPPPWTASAWRV